MAGEEEEEEERKKGDKRKKRGTFIMSFIHKSTRCIHVHTFENSQNKFKKKPTRELGVR
jgi:hypothetical protein